MKPPSTAGQRQPSVDLLLTDWANHLSDTAKRSTANRVNEAELRLDVHPQIIAAANALYGVDALTSTAERRGHRGTLRTYDNLYGGVVVEWEWNMTPTHREHGAQQALDYLSDLRQQAGNDAAFTAVVSDGHQWGFLVVDPADEATLFDTPPVNATEHFEWHSNSSGTCRRFLELVGSNQKQPITANTLQASFGPASSTTRQMITLLVEGLAGKSTGDRIDVLYREWRRALDVVYGDLDATSGKMAEHLGETYEVRVDRPVGEYLFALHTYFALIARLFAVEILAIATSDRNRPTNWAGGSNTELLQALSDLDQGVLPGSLDIDNLFESDVFSWWLNLARSSIDLISVLRSTLSALDSFAFPRTVLGPQKATDVLGDLYQSLVPRQLRRALGEFLTPHWLAEACLQRLRLLGADLETGRILDPTCGTGSFLIPALSERIGRLRTLRRTSEISPIQVQAVLDTVAGIDLNPIAVVATRVNFVLTLGSLASSGSLTIPVWRADSLLVPDSPPRQGKTTDGDLIGLRFRELRTSLPDPFPFPTSFASAEQMTVVRQSIERALSDPSPDSALQLFIEHIECELGPDATSPCCDAEDWEAERTVAVELYKRIRELADADRDGIWAQIIANAFAPLFAGQFDVIVGNPPWLAWGRLPESWRSGSERLWRRYGLWNLPAEPGDKGRVLQVSDIAQLVFAVAVERYATSSAMIGLLTPKSIISANPGGRAFRKFHLQSDDSYDGDKVDVKFGIVGVDDWSEIKPFAPLASNSPVFLVAKKNQPQKYPVSAWRWYRESRARLTGSWMTVRTSLEAQEGTYSPVSPKVPTSAWAFRPAGSTGMLEGGTNRWSFGIGLHTRGANGIYFVKVLRGLLRQAQVEIENIPSEGRNQAVRKRRGRVEARSVYPLLRGRDVAPWVAMPTEFVVAPHRPQEFDQVLSSNDLSARGEFPLLGTWLRQFKTILEQRKTPPNRTWEMHGDDWCRLEGPLSYMRGDHLVVVREIAGNFGAAVVEKRYNEKLGRSVAPLVEHKLLFCSVETRDEAVYLACFINSGPAQDLLASFASTTGLTPKALRTLPIPDFDKHDDNARLLVDHGLEILAATVGDREEVALGRAAEVDSAVLRLGHSEAVAFISQSRPIKQTKQSAVSNDAPGLW